jgi:uroporphyrinogen III methyltransferase/synthase
LEQADVVIYDYLVDRRVLKYANSDAELICGDELTRERHSDGFAKRQGIINKIMVERAREGKKVVRLKNGDPFIFGRAREEIEALTQSKIEFAVIPGITAANAAACFTGIPLTARGISSSVVITTGHEASEKSKSFINWEKIAQIDTVVLYMAVENLSQITQKLMAGGKRADTPVAVISQVSKIGQKIVVGSLENIEDKVRAEKISAPAIVIVGEVVRKEKDFNWFRKAKKVLFTGLSGERFFKRGIFFPLPLIQIKPLKDYAQMDSLIKRMDIFDWIIFTSRFGVLYFFQELFKMGFDSRNLGGVKVAAIGSSTAEKLRKYGIIADLIPPEESSAGLLSEFKKLNIRENKVLLPRSDLADESLSEGLKNLGAEVYTCVAYRNVMPENLPELDLNFFDEIIFTSPSTLRNFIKRYGKPPERVRIRTIGPLTAKEAEKWNLIG